VAWEKITPCNSGTVTTLYAQENYSVNTDEPLLELADLSDIKIILEVPEYEVKEIKLDQKLVIKPEVFEKKISYPGVITKISRVSQVSKTTSENVLQVEVRPTEEIPHIVPGFKVSARIFLGEDEPGIIIPSTSLLFDNNQYYIYTSDEAGKIQKRAHDIPVNTFMAVPSFISYINHCFLTLCGILFCSRSGKKVQKLSVRRYPLKSL